MTSRNLFFKLLKEDMKRRTWSIALSTLVLMILLPIIGALNISTYSRGTLEDWEFRQLIRFIGPRYELAIVVTVICAVVCGLSGFFYLHSRKKVDLLHSIPVRREILFFASYVNGILIYFIPYIINLLITLLIFQLNGYLNAEVFKAAVMGLGISLLFFSLIYTLTIVAVMLTGNIIISFCGISVFLLYAPVIRLIKDQYYSGFFSTYFNDDIITIKTSFLSPLENYINIAFENLKGKEYILSIITTILVTILLIGFALFLYRNRPSESAGKSMAFQISKAIIKFLLVIPISLGGGMFLRSAVSYGKDAWFIFGAAFCFIVIYGIIQVMFEFDIKSAFHHKKQMLACVIMIGVISIIFRFDVFGYDKYIPKENEIKSMSVSIAGIDQGLDHYEFVDGENVFNRSMIYELKKMKLTDYNAAYEMAKIAVENKAEGSMAIQNNYNYSYKYNSYVKYNYDVYNYNTFRYYVKYNLKDGREIYRCYGLKLEECKNYLSEIYADPAYKKAHYPIYQWEEDKINQISVTYGSEILNFSSTGKDSKEFVNFSLGGNSVNQLAQIYKEELSSLTLEKAISEYPVAKLNFEVNNVIFQNYYVYPSFVKTIVFLNEHGFDTTKMIDPNNVLEISIYNYEPVKMSIGENSVVATAEIYKPILYNDGQKILEILPALIQNDYYQENSAIIDIEDNIEVNMVYKIGENGLSESFTYRFLKDRIPENVKLDLGIKKN